MGNSEFVLKSDSKIVRRVMAAVSKGEVGSAA